MARRLRMSRPSVRAGFLLPLWILGLTEDCQPGRFAARMVFLLLPYILTTDRPPLFAEAKFADDVTVPLDICLVEVGQMPSTPSHQL